MSHTVPARDNALSRSMGTIPMWLVQALVGVLLAGALAWVSFIARASAQNTTDIAVVKTEVGSVKDDISDIKQDTREIKALLMQQRGR